MARDNQDKDVQPGEVLGLGRGPIVQTDEDRALRDNDRSTATGHSDEQIRNERTARQTPYGVPKPPQGLHIED
jgi:hypothetical protein